MKKIITILLSTLLFSVFGQAPQSFNYQGAARNAQGEVLAQKQIKLKVSILEGSSNGISAYTETHLVTTSELGLFAVQIGRGEIISGSFKTINWSLGSKFLNVAMDINGGNNFLEMGASQLLSTPYALYAEKSGSSIWNTDAKGINYNGNVGIGTLSSEYPLELKTNSIGQSNNRYLIALSNSSTDNYATTKIIFKSADANVGVGTIGLNNSSYAYNNNASTFVIASSATNGLQLHTEKSKIAFNIGKDDNQNKEKMVLNASGNLGIGTKTPNSKLQITDGDIYITDVNKGVILTSPNGSCFRMTVSNAGTPVVTAITCP